jgi:hypothetical protein
VWAHCLYFRAPESLLTGASELQRRRLVRLLALALAFQHFDFVFETAAVIARAGLLSQADVGRLGVELEQSAALATRYMAHKAAEHGLGDRILAATFRDRTQLV